MPRICSFKNVRASGENLFLVNMQIEEYAIAQAKMKVGKEELASPMWWWWVGEADGGGVICVGAEGAPNQAASVQNVPKANEHRQPKEMYSCSVIETKKKKSRAENVGN
jgi:hypothetical protein